MCQCLIHCQYCGKLTRNSAPNTKTFMFRKGECNFTPVNNIYINVILYVGLYFGRSDGVRLKYGSHVQLDLRSTGWCPLIAKYNTHLYGPWVIILQYEIDFK